MLNDVSEKLSQHVYVIILMRLLDKMVQNRMNVAFVLFILLMVSCIFPAKINDIIAIVPPSIIALLIIFWLVYSSIRKTELIKNKIITSKHRDYLEDMESIFKPGSITKKIFAAYGLSVGFFIVFMLICIVISQYFIEVLLNSYLLHFVFVLIYGISYLIVKDRLK